MIFYYTKQFYNDDVFAIQESHAEMDGETKIKLGFRRDISILKFANNIGKTVEDIVDGDYNEVIAYIPPVLSQVLEAKLNSFKVRTTELINDGFNYDGNTFNADASSRTNYSDIKYSIDDFTDPIPLLTRYRDVYLLAKNDINAFWLAGKLHMENCYGSEAPLNIAAKAATTIAELESVIDER